MQDPDRDREKAPVWRKLRVGGLIRLDRQLPIGYACSRCACAE
jgi:hypothetical protein